MARSRDQYLADLKKHKDSVAADRLKRRARAADLFRLGHSLDNVRNQIEWGRGDGGLAVVQREAVRDMDVKAIAAGPILNALELNKFGSRPAPNNLPAEQLSILSICDGQMNSAAA